MATHYDAADLWDLVADPDGGRRVTLDEGDTAYAPGTTKHVLTGAGEYTYWLTSIGERVDVPEGARRTPR